MKSDINDFDFGSLEFQDIQGMLSYNCKLSLPISKKEVEVFFETDSQDRLPTLPQKQFIMFLVDNYNKVLAAIASQLPNEMDTFGQGKRIPLQEEFDLDTIGISLDIQNIQKWDLSLKSRTKKSLSLLADFNGLIPNKVWVENESKLHWFLSLLKALGLR